MLRRQTRADPNVLSDGKKKAKKSNKASLQNVPEGSETKPELKKQGTTVVGLEDMEESTVWNPLHVGGFLLATFLISTMAFSLARGATFVDSMYVVFVTFTTVGYGDEVIMGEHHRLLGILVIFFGVTVLGYLIGLLFNYAQDSTPAWEIQADADESQLEYDMRRVLMSFIINTFAITIILFFGAYTMCFLEDWDWEDSVYWAAQTMTTVGYGDQTPVSVWGKMFTIFYIFVSVPMVSYSMAYVSQVPILLRRTSLEYNVLKQFGSTLDDTQLDVMVCHPALRHIRRDRHHEKKSVSRGEFVLVMLIQLKKTDPDEIQRCGEIFDELDRDGSGILDEGDIDSFKDQVAIQRKNGERPSVAASVLGFARPSARPSAR